MTEPNLDKLRKKYVKIKPNELLVQNGWDDLRVKIASVEQEKRKSSLASRRKPALLSGLLFASILLLVLVPTVSFAQKAKEGDILFPVKVVTDHIVSTINNLPEMAEEGLNSPLTTPKPKLSPAIEATKEAEKDEITPEAENDDNPGSVKGLEHKPEDVGSNSGNAAKNADLKKALPRIEEGTTQAESKPKDNTHNGESLKKEDVDSNSENNGDNSNREPKSNNKNSENKVQQSNSKKEN